MTPDYEVVISPSQLQVWDRCENWWKFNYRWGYVPIRTRDYFQVGSFVHSLLAVHYRARMNGKRDTWDDVMKFAEEDVDFSAMDADEVTSWKRSIRIVQRYINEYAPANDNFRILDVERHFIVPMVSPGGFQYKLQGYFDLLIELNGQMWLWDHKTVGQSKFWSSAEAEMDPQMTMYQLGLKTQGYNIMGTYINQLNTYDYVKTKQNPQGFDGIPLDKLYRRLHTYRTEKQILNMNIEVGKAVDEIVRSLEAASYRKSLRKECRSCPYREPCLMELKGLNPRGMMEEAFKLKEPRPTEDEPEDTYAFEI